MKKFVTLMLVILLVAVTFVGCASPTDTEEPAPVEGQEGEAVEEGDIAKLGLGHVISTAKSKGAEGDNTAQAQADVTVAAVGFDSEGRVASVSIDVAQTRVAFDEDMAVSNRDAELLTKKELEDEYGMRKASAIDKEWFEQAQALEEWMIGKTVEEILNMERTDDVPDVEELTSSVTIKVEGYLAAVEEAWENARDVEGAVKVGLALDTSIEKSRDASDDQNAQAQVDTYIAATAFDGDNNVVGVIIDTAQVRVAFDEEGQVESDIEVEGQTKKELEDEYGMRKASGIDKEWFEQAQALEEWMVGQTVEEILNMERTDDVPDVEELTSSVTIKVEGYLSIVEKSFKNAR